MDSNAAKASVVTVLAAGLGIGGLAVVHNSQWHDQHGKIVIAAGNPQYYDLGIQYKEELRKYGVEVEVRRTTRIKDKEGRTLIEIPLTIGVVGAILLPVWAAIGAIAALVAEATIVVEKVES